MNLRQLVTDRLALADTAGAAEALRQLWQQSPAQHPFVLRTLTQLESAVPLRRRARLAILRNYTIEPLLGMLACEARWWGLDLEIWVGPFDQMHQLLRRPSALDEFQPDLVLISALQHPYLEDWQLSLASWRERSSAAILIQDEAPLGAESPLQRQKRVRYNQELEQWLAGVSEAYCLHQSAWVAEQGWKNIYAERLGLPFRSHSHRSLVRHWVAGLAPVLGLQAKVIVTDLDQTLWEGIIDEGPVQAPPGSPFLGYQRQLLELRGQGYLLAIASKNDSQLALQTLQEHPELCVRPEHFSSLCINWQSKAENLLGMAEELGLGLDSFVFVDDSPFEQEQMRRQLPQVAVLDYQSPDQLVELLAHCPLLQRLHLSEEDLQRSQHYQLQDLRASTVDLQLEVESFAVGDHLLRASQLTQKTNQFNLTHLRLTVAQLEEHLRAPGWNRIFRVRDRFGDYGLVGLILAHQEGQQLVIDNFLLSCRALGRGVEEKMLAELERSGFSTLVGYYQEHPRNQGVADFYPRHGFIPVGENRWRRDCELR